MSVEESESESKSPEMDVVGCSLDEAINQYETGGRTGVGRGLVVLNSRLFVIEQGNEGDHREDS